MATASFANRRPIDVARSSPVVPAGSVFVVPSGNFTVNSWAMAPEAIGRPPPLPRELDRDGLLTDVPDPGRLRRERVRTLRGVAVLVPLPGHLPDLEHHLVDQLAVGEMV